MHHATLLQHYLSLAQPYLQDYGYLAVFVGVMIEGFGVPAPGESLIIASGLLAAKGKMGIWGLLVGWAAAVIGDNIGYAIGHFGGRHLVLAKGRRFGVRPDHLERVEAFFARYGGGIVAFARFIEVLRQLNGVVAGTSGMPWWRFLFFNALGAALWVAVWGLGAYFLGVHLEGALRVFKAFEPYIAAAGLIALGFLAWYLLRRHKRNH